MSDPNKFGTSKPPRMKKAISASAENLKLFPLTLLQVYEHGNDYCGNLPPGRIHIDIVYVPSVV